MTHVAPSCLSALPHQTHTLTHKHTHSPPPFTTSSPPSDSAPLFCLSSPSLLLPARRLHCIAEFISLKSAGYRKADRLAPHTSVSLKYSFNQQGRRCLRLLSEMDARMDRKHTFTLQTCRCVYIRGTQAHLKPVRHGLMRLDEEEAMEGRWDIIPLSQELS